MVSLLLLAKNILLFELTSVHSNFLYHNIVLLLAIEVSEVFLLF
jgi:hypothetical protein